MSTDTFSRTGALDTSERARAAVAEFRRMLPNLSGYARALTGKPNVEVVMSGHDNGSTDGQKIYFRPPIELAESYTHERSKCDRRDENGQQICDACRVREDIYAVIYHEIAHIAFDSFAKPRPEQIKQALDLGFADCPDTEWVQSKIDHVQSAPLWMRNDWLQLASPISPFLPLLVNALEDARVNRAMFEARLGVRAMFEALVYRVFSEGFEASDGRGGVRTVKWAEQPLNSQVTVGVFCKVSGYDYKGWFHESVVEALDDPELSRILRQMSTARTAAAVYTVSIPTLVRLRDLGFFLEPNEREPEPDPEPESSDEENENDDTDESDDSSDQPSESGDTEETGDEESADDDSTEGADSPGDGSDESDDDSDDTGSGGDSEGDDDGESDDVSSGDETDDDADAESNGADEDPDDSATPGSGSHEPGPDGDDGSDDPSEDDASDGDEGSSGDMGDPDGDASGAGASGIATSSGSSDPDQPDSSEEEVGEGASPLDEVDDDFDAHAVRMKDNPGNDEKPIPEYGEAEDVEAALLKFGEHDEVPTHLREGEESDALETAIVQGIYFETDSRNIRGVKFWHYGTSEKLTEYNAWRDDWHNQPARQVDLETPESVLGKALLKARVVFEANARSKNLRNLKNGRVNSRVLGRRVAFDDERLFKRKVVPGKRSYCVIIGVDVSGSTRGTNILLEKKSVAAMAAMLDRLGVEFAIYAHSGNYTDYSAGRSGGIDLEIYPIKTLDERWDPKTKIRLQDLGSGAANLDGHALEFLRKRADESRATDRIILYHSDGQMPAENHDEELTILRREIKTCARKGYTLLGVGINTDSPARHGLETVEVNKVDDVVKVVTFLERKLI